MELIFFVSYVIKLCGFGYDDVTSYSCNPDKSHGLETRERYVCVCVLLLLDSREMNNPKLMHVDDGAYDYYYCK